ncbi:hypothetical protein G4Y79_19250 [Phototrophicus methaneseepsis]|uniref:Tetratricopeptide repeat protein n=1 Tax=Phototrophicus methaneseepsis TaxID=2710758 RepID=A0A7S8E7J6_9CHLR|nr:hypothetical protein [Phototrophicus methaneseepsis]QPC81806.1 hypothetical protein G4Y79_19250 [Phototrophicus methaneseepsis]
MSWLDRFIKWVSGAEDAPTPSQQTPPKANNALESILEQGRQAQYDEAYDTAMQHYKHAREVAQRQMDATSEADALLHQADVLIAQGSFKEAETLLGELQTKAQNTQHRAPLAYALISRGVLAQARGAYEEARNLYEQGRRHAETIGSNGAQGRAMCHLADIYLAENNSGYAVKLLREGLTILQESGDTELLPYFRMRLADALIAAQDESAVSDLLHIAYKEATEAQHKPYRRMTALRVAEYAAQTGDSLTAYQFFKLALDLFSRTPANTSRYADILLSYSQAALQTGNQAEARTVAEKALYAAQSLGDEGRMREAQDILAAATPGGLAQKTQPHPTAPSMPEAITAQAVDQPTSQQDEVIQPASETLVVGEPAAAEAVQATAETVTTPEEAVVSEPATEESAAKESAMIAPVASAPNPLVDALVTEASEPEEDEDPIAGFINRAKRQQAENDPEGSIKSLQKAMELAAEADSQTHRITIHQLMASAYRMQRQFEEAIEQQKVAYLIAKQTRDRRTSVKLLNQLATDQRELGLLGDALRSVDDTLLLLSSVDDRRIRQTALTLAGSLYGTQGDTASADAFFQEALMLSSALGDQNLRASTLLEYATMLIATNRTAEAKKQIEEARPAAASRQLAQVLGYWHAANGEWADALIQFEAVAKGRDESDDQLETERAKMLAELGRYDDAANLLRRAMQKAREQRRLGMLIEVLLIQARLLSERGKPQAAIDSLENVLKFAKQAQSPRQQAQAYVVLSKIRASMDDIETAQTDWEQARQLIERHSMPRIQPDWLPQA